MCKQWSSQYIAYQGRRLGMGNGGAFGEDLGLAGPFWTICITVNGHDKLLVGT